MSPYFLEYLGEILSLGAALCIMLGYFVGLVTGLRRRRRLAREMAQRRPRE